MTMVLRSGLLARRVASVASFSYSGGRQSFASVSSLQQKAMKALGKKPEENPKKMDQKETKEPKNMIKLNDDVVVQPPPADQPQESRKEKIPSKPEQTEPAPAPSLAQVQDPVQPPRTPQLHEFAPRIVVAGVGGAGGNAINNMIAKDLQGVDFIALNTDAQHLSTTLTDARVQLGLDLTRGLGCGANPDAGRLAAEDSKEEIMEFLQDAHMVFITAGMGGGTGTGAAPVVAELCYELGILTVGVVTLPFRFEGTHRARLAQEGVARLTPVVDTLLTIPNQNLMALADENTTMVDAFAMADNVLLGGVKSISDLMTRPGLINLDFADVQSVMHGMGHAWLGTGICEGPDRAVEAARMALDHPLLGASQSSIGTAKGMLVNISGGKDMTLFEVDRAAQCVTEQVTDESANIIFGSAYEEELQGKIRVSVVATGIEPN